MKKLAAFIFCVLLMMLPVSEARADFELFQKIIGKIKNVTKKASTVIKDISSEYRQLNEQVAGVKGMKDNLKVEEIAGLKPKIGGINLPSSIENVNDHDKTIENIKQNFVSVRGQGEDVAAYLENEQKLTETDRENAVRLYAVAYITRVNLNNEKKEKASEKEDTRDIIQDAAKEDLEASKRLSRISALQAASYQLRMNKRMRTLTNRPETEGKTAGGAQ